MHGRDRHLQDVSWELSVAWVVAPTSTQAHPFTDTEIFRALGWSELATAEYYVVASPLDRPDNPAKSRMVGDAEVPITERHYVQIAERPETLGKGVDHRCKDAH